MFSFLVTCINLRNILLSVMVGPIIRSYTIPFICSWYVYILVHYHDYLSIVVAKNIFDSNYIINKSICTIPLYNLTRKKERYFITFLYSTCSMKSWCLWYTFDRQAVFNTCTCKLTDKSIRSTKPNNVMCSIIMIIIYILLKANTIGKLP